MFWRVVAWRPNAHRGGAAGDKTTEAKVTELEGEVSAEHDVVGFDVAVGTPADMHSLHSPHKLDKEMAGKTSGERSRLENSVGRVSCARRTTVD